MRNPLREWNELTPRLHGIILTQKIRRPELFCGTQIETEIKPLIRQAKDYLIQSYEIE